MKVTFILPGFPVKLTVDFKKINSYVDLLLVRRN